MKNKFFSLLTSMTLMTPLVTTPLVSLTENVVLADEKEDKEDKDKKDENKDDKEKDDSNSEESDSDSGSEDEKSEDLKENEDVKGALSKYNNIFNDGFPSAAKSVVMNKSKYNRDMQVLLTYISLKDGFYSGSNYTDLFSQEKSEGIKSVVDDFNKQKVGYEIKGDKIFGNGKFLEHLSQEQDEDKQKSKADQTGSATPNGEDNPVKADQDGLDGEITKIAEKLAKNLVNAYGLSDNRKPGIIIGWDSSGNKVSSDVDGGFKKNRTIEWPKSCLFAYYSPNSDNKNIYPDNAVINNIDGYHKHMYKNTNVSYYDDLIVNNRAPSKEVVSALKEEIMNVAEKTLKDKDVDEAKKYLENLSLKELFSGNENGNLDTILSDKIFKGTIPLSNIKKNQNLGNIWHLDLTTHGGFTSGPIFKISSEQKMSSENIEEYLEDAKKRTEILNGESVTFKGVKTIANSALDKKLQGASKFNAHVQELVNKKADVKLDEDKLKKFKNDVKENEKKLEANSDSSAALMTWNWIAPYHKDWSGNEHELLGKNKKIMLNNGIMKYKFKEEKFNAYPFTQNFFNNKDEMEDVLKDKNIKPFSLLKGKGRDSSLAPGIALDGNSKTIISSDNKDELNSLPLIAPGFYDEIGENPESYLKDTVTYSYYDYLKSNKDNKLGDGSDVFGVDNYGNIINGQKSILMVPNYQNPFLVDLCNLNIKGNSFLNTADSKYFNYGNDGKVIPEFDQSEDEIKSFGFGKGAAKALVDNKDETKNIKTGKDYISYVNKNVGESGDTKLSDKACAALAVVISSKAEPEIKKFNEKMLSDSQNNNELYLGKSDAKPKEKLNEKQGDGTYLYTATDIIQRAGLQSDVGIWATMRKTIVGMLVDGYNSSFMKSGKQNIFQTKTNGISAFSFGSAIYYGIVIILILSWLWLLIRKYLLKDSRVTLMSFVMNILKSVVLVFILAVQPIVAEVMVNMPGKICIDAPLKRQSVLDQWNNIRQQQKIENPLYSALFNDTFGQINTSKSYILKFYTTTTIDGKNPNKNKDNQEIKNKENKKKMDEYNAKQDKLKETNDAARKANQANQEAAKSKVNLDPLQKLADTQAAQLKGNGSVPFLAPYQYKTVNIASSDLLSWAIHMYRQVRTAEKAKGFEEGKIGYEEPNGDYPPGETPLFVWLDKYYEPLGEKKDSSSPEENEKDLKDSLGDSENKDKKEENSDKKDDEKSGDAKEISEDISVVNADEDETDGKVVLEKDINDSHYKELKLKDGTTVSIMQNKDGSETKVYFDKNNQETKTIVIDKNGDEIDKSKGYGTLLIDEWPKKDRDLRNNWNQVANLFKKVLSSSGDCSRKAIAKNNAKNFGKANDILQKKLKKSPVKLSDSGAINRSAIMTTITQAKNEIAKLDGKHQNIMDESKTKEKQKEKKEKEKKDKEKEKKDKDSEKSDSEGDDSSESEDKESKDDESKNQNQMPEEEKVEEDNENLGITKAGQDAGTGDDAYGKRRNPADTSLKSAYSTGVKNSQVSDNGARYKGLSEQTEYAVNTKHYAKEYDKRFGTDSDSKNLANTEVTNNTKISKDNKDNTMLTASQLFLRIFMTTYSREGVTSPTTKDPDIKENKLSKAEETQGIENYNALMNFAQAFNGNIQNIQDGNEEINSATIGTVGLTSLIDQVSMTKQQRIALNGQNQYSKAAKDVMDAYKINRPTDDWLGLGLTNSPLDVIHPYFGKKQNQTRDGLIFKINKKFLTDYIDIYSDVRAIIQPGDSNSQGSNNEGNEDPFSMAEAHVLALNEWFLINKYTNQRMFPQGYQADTISIDTWNRMLTIPIGEMKNKTDNSQYDSWDRFNMSSMALQDNTAEYIGVNYSTFLLFFFVVMTLLLVILGLTMSMIVGFIMPIMSLLSLFKAFFVNTELKFKDIIYGAFGTYLLFGLMKVGLVGVIATLSNSMNNSFAKTGVVTDGRIWGNILTVILVLVVELLLIVGYTMSLIRNKMTFGATKGQGFFKGVGSVFTNAFNQSPLIHHLNPEETKQFGKRIGRGSIRGGKTLVRKTTNVITDNLTPRGIGRHVNNIKAYKEGTRNGHGLQGMKNKISTMKYIQTLDRFKDSTKSRLSKKQRQKETADLVNNIKNAQFGSIEETYANGLDKDKVDRAANGDILNTNKDLGTYQIDLLGKTGLTKDELDSLSKLNKNLNIQNGILTIDGFSRDAINNPRLRKEMLKKTLNELDETITELHNNPFSRFNTDARAKTIIGNIDSDKKMIKLRIADMNAKDFRNFERNLHALGLEPAGKVYKDANGNVLSQTISIKPENLEMDSRRFSNLFNSKLQTTFSKIPVMETPSRYSFNIGDGKTVDEIIKMTGVGRRNGNELLVDNNNEKYIIKDFLEKQNRMKASKELNAQRLAAAMSDFVVDGPGHGFTKEDIHFMDNNSNSFVYQIKSTNANEVVSVLNKMKKLAENSSYLEICGKALNNQEQLTNSLYNEYNGAFGMNKEILNAIKSNGLDVSRDVMNQMKLMNQDAKNSGKFNNLSKDSQIKYANNLNNIINSLKDEGQWNQIKNTISDNCNNSTIRALNDQDNKVIESLTKDFGKDSSKLKSLSSDKLIEMINSSAGINVSVSDNMIINAETNNNTRKNKNRLSNLVKILN